MEEMCKFVFWQFDKEKKSNTIQKDELEFFVEKSHNGIKGNIRTAINQLKDLYDEQTETLTFSLFQSFCKSYPGILFPIFRLQQSIKLHIMGESWWEKKRNRLQENRSTLMIRAERKRIKEERRLIRERRRIIQSQMGLFAFYWKKERRKHYEKVHVLPVVYLDEEYFVRVKYDNEKIK